jgi:uncharacterized protein (TIGR02265 family)
MADSFTVPNTGAPLDLEQRLAKVPPTTTVKGMFMQAIADEARAVSGATQGRGRWLAFKDYPLREWLTLLVDCARAAHPRVSAREGIRRLGQNAYPMFARSTIGKVVMSVAGDNFALALRQVPRVYAVSGNGVTAELAEQREGRAIVQLRGVWDFPDAWQVGAFEGALDAFRKEGSVRVRILSLCDVDLELTWQ